MTKSRPPYQLELALPRPGRGEALRRDVQEIEAVTAMAERESPASTAHLMEAICAPDNIEAALRAVVRNKGAPGVDGITVRRLPGILKARWPEIEHQLLLEYLFAASSVADSKAAGIVADIAVEDVAAGELLLVLGRIELRDRVDDVQLGLGSEAIQHEGSGLAAQRADLDDPPGSRRPQYRPDNAFPERIHRLGPRPLS